MAVLELWQLRSIFFDEDLVVVTMIWPFKSFMRPDRERQTNFAAFRRHLHPGWSGVGGGAFRGPPIILHLLLHPDITVQSAKWMKWGRVYCLFGAKGLTPGSPGALPPPTLVQI